jgi:hypothetical protein
MADAKLIPSIPPTLSEALFSALGYFSVVVACTLAGYAVAHRSFLPSKDEWPVFVFFLAVLFPVYMNRAILYELRLGDFGDHAVKLAWLRAFGIQVPLVLLAVGASLGALLLFYAGPPAGSTFVRVVTRVVVTVAPMYFISGRLTLRWPEDVSLFTFIHRSFFPAFATCLTPFVFGYAGYGDTKCCAWAAACVLAYWSLSFVTPVRRFAFVGIACLLSLTLLQLLWMKSTTAPDRCARVVFFGTLMTLAMGVSEAERVTTRILDDDIFRKGGEYQPSEKSFYLGGTNLATALFLPCFWLTAIHPSTTGLYLVLTSVLFTLQYLCWFTRALRSRIPWRTFGVFSGLFLPVVVALGTQFPHTEGWHSRLVLATDLATLLAIISFDVLVVGTLTTFFARSTVKREPPVGYSRLYFFESAIPCVCVTGILSGILSAAIAVAGHLIPVPIGELPRMAALDELYLLAGLLCFIVVSINSLYTKMRPIFTRIQMRSEQKDAGANQSCIAKAADILWGSLSLTRLPSSAIAGLLSGMLVFRVLGSIDTATRAGLAMTLTAMFGFVVDDIDDLPTDLVIHKNTALTVKRVSISDAWVLSVCLVVSALLLSPGGITGRIIVGVTLGALYYYYHLSRAAPSLKGLYTATLACTPLFYGAFIGRCDIPVGIFISLWIFIVGRELFIDASQIDADSSVGFRTLAVQWGRTSSELLALTLMLMGTGILGIFVHTILSEILVIVTAATVVGVFFAPIPSSDRPGFLKISLVMGICATVAAL